jgi:hypothetical protein
MRTILASLISNAALVATIGLTGVAAAQDAAPTPAAAPAAPAPAATPAAATDATVPTTTAAPAPAALEATTPPPAAGAIPAAPPAEEAKPIPSYFRIDHDYMFGLQLWAGATYPITDTIGLATDVYIAENYPAAALTTDASGAPTGAGIAQSYWGEFDIGPALTFGPLSLTPMVGIAFDWAAKRAVAINGPQLYTILNLDHFYFESWVWTMLYSAFKKDGANDYIHTRNWFLYKPNSVIGFGPQLEYTYDLEAKQTAFGFPVGGHVELSYGTGNSLGLFVGYDTKKATHAADDTAAVGRITFVHNF